MIQRAAGRSRTGAIGADESFDRLTLSQDGRDLDARGGDPGMGHKDRRGLFE
jgi:hypothetical protein